jgi:hypothetical protein
MWVQFRRAHGREGPGAAGGRFRSRARDSHPALSASALADGYSYGNYGDSYGYGYGYDEGYGYGGYAGNYAEGGGDAGYDGGYGGDFSGYADSYDEYGYYGEEARAGRGRL